MKKVGLSVLALLLIAYVGGIIYFTQSTFPNTTINGEDRSFENIGNLFQYKGTYDPVTIVGKEGKSAVVQPADIELSKRPKGNPAVAQNAVAWPAAFFTQHPYEVEYESLYNEEKLTAILKESDLLRFQTDPVDAKIVQTETGFVIEPEKTGTAITQENLIKAIIHGISAGETTVEIPEEAYNQPKVVAEDPALKEELESKNKLFNTKIVYDFVDREYTYTGETLAALYEETDEGEKISYEKARELIRQMAIETDTFESTRMFVNSYGNEIELEGGIYGWLMDVDETTEEFIGFVENRESIETTPFYTQEAMHREKDDIGNTYVEIDTYGQWMWIYVDGEIIDQGPTVTGQPNLDARTPTGVNYIRNKERDRYLKGISPETGREYDSLVNFWFPINWNDIGIHNSTWRDEFGGDIYTYNGSYGCINVTDHLAQTIFDSVPYGAPVITY